MVELSLLERLKLVFSLIFSSPLFLILLLGIAIMLVDSFIISKKSKKTKILYLIISILSIVILLHNYYNSIFDIFDTIAKNIVAIIYFPSALEYVIIMVISLLVLIVSLLNRKTNKKIKFINFLIFILELFLFFLILDELSKQKIDLANKINIYSNVNLMALFELSVIIFIVWMVFLILYKIIYKLTHKEEKIVVNERSFYEEPELPKTIEELRKEELVPPPQIEYIVVEKKNDNDMFTLEEYKALKVLLENMKNNKN